MSGLEVTTETIAIDRIEFETKGDISLVHVWEAGPEGRRFSSKLKDKIELAHRFQDAERLDVAYSKSRWRGGWNYFIEDLAHAPLDWDEAEQTPESMPGTFGIPAMPALGPLDSSGVTMRAVELAVEMAKLDSKGRALVCRLTPLLLDAFRTSANAEPLRQLSDVLGFAPPEKVQPTSPPLGQIDWWPSEAELEGIETEDDLSFLAEELDKRPTR